MAPEMGVDGASFRRPAGTDGAELQHEVINMRIHRPTFLALALLPTLALTGCAGTMPMVRLNAGAQSVRVAKADPPAGYVSLGPITATNGHGCGGFGKLGTYANAVTQLRNEAHAMGADYVEIYQLIPPSPPGVGRPGLCYHDAYQITGMAYKQR